MLKSIEGKEMMKLKKVNNIEMDNDLLEDLAEGIVGIGDCTCTARALIVDDAEFNIIPLKMILHTLGIEAIKASNGQ